ncbi:MAG: hypothetical protein ISS66_00990 [Desulfobacteraceae bacterium]|nr:hypothetical protein [Desulfobacteraceae bacterium]
MFYHYHFTPPIMVPPEAAADDAPETREVLQQLAGWLSGVIRKHPEQWWGIYRHWR